MTLISQTSVTRGLAPDNSNQLFHNYPLYLRPFDYPGMALVTTSFNNTGYGSRGREMLISLHAKKEIRFYCW